MNIFDWLSTEPCEFIDWLTENKEILDKFDGLSILKDVERQVNQQV